MQPVATFSDGALTVQIGDFTYRKHVDDIRQCFDAISHSPERRATIELRDLAGRINQFAEHVQALQDRGGSISAADVERFARRHVQLCTRFWDLEARCTSAFVVGPAKFPVRSNEMRLRARDAAMRAIGDHVTKARDAAARRQARLNTTEGCQAHGTVEREDNTDIGSVRIVENPDLARVQVFFDGKPSAEVRATLKKNGFRWAPSEGAWQRHLNDGGRRAAADIVSSLQPVEQV